MNITENLKFTPEKPATYMVLKSEKLQIVAIGLWQNQVLSKHKTVFPVLLTVLKGSIAFKLPSETIELKELDVFEIPVNVEHEVLGLETENIFSLTIQK